MASFALKLLSDIILSQVYLLKPRSAAQEYFERLADLLEQFVFLTFLCQSLLSILPLTHPYIAETFWCSRYYHPSNGGRWTHSLERFLRYLVVYFQKRLQNEQR